MRLHGYYISSLLFVLWCLRHFAKKDSTQRFHFLWVLSWINLISYLLNLVYFSRIAHPLTLLPLQLCNIGVILIPWALKTQRTWIVDFLVYACGCGALAAILIVSKDYEDVYSIFTFSFYVFHFLIFIIPILMGVWGFYTIHPTVKIAMTVTLELIILSLFIHGINLLLNDYGIPANYFFTLRALSVTTNVAFKWFASLIPYDYFYMYLVFPILYLYMALLKKIVWFLTKRPYKRWFVFRHSSLSV